MDMTRTVDHGGLNRRAAYASITVAALLLAMKAYDTRWACELIKPHLASDGMLIGMQNAMEALTIVDVVGAERTVGCVIELSSEMFTPGLVKRNTEPARTVTTGGPGAASMPRWASTSPRTGGR